jgi:cell wall-associated NlpC family hydrolase
MRMKDPKNDRVEQYKVPVSPSNASFNRSKYHSDGIQRLARTVTLGILSVHAMKQLATQLFCFVSLAMLQACTSAPEKAPPPPSNAVLPSSGMPGASVGSEIALRAISLVGTPYQWGGNGPNSFDCSGLVRYVHDQLGIETPRTAAEQYEAAKPVTLNGLAPGDLLFFRTKGKGRAISHVAIYAGEGRFVHAPQTGRTVELRMLDDEFYASRFVGAGRLF